MKMGLGVKSLCALAVMFAASTAANAAVSFGLDVKINGDAPARDDVTKAYLTATFENDGANKVKLTLDATNLETVSSTQFIVDWLFNLSPTYDFTSNPLTFSLLTSNVIEATGFPQTGQNFSNGGNSIKGGLFDIQFSFQTSNSPAGGRFFEDEVVVYSIMANGLTEDAFKFKSAPDGTKPNDPQGGYYSAAKLQGLPNNGSGSVGGMTFTNGGGGGGGGGGVPEPMSVAVWSVLGLTFAGARYLRRS